MVKQGVLGLGTRLHTPAPSLLHTARLLSSSLPFSPSSSPHLLLPTLSYLLFTSFLPAGHLRVLYPTTTTIPPCRHPPPCISHQSDQAGGSRSNTNPCQAILWHRIVFDEGHTLRNASAKLAKTANELAAQRKWPCPSNSLLRSVLRAGFLTALRHSRDSAPARVSLTWCLTMLAWFTSRAGRWLCTGTPINTAVEDLMGQLAALHMAPLSKKSFFDGNIKV